jgi:ABC-type antimicrobial peptide transport system permease subunit
VEGSNNIADVNAILITERTAKKYFGNSRAVGKVLTLYAGESYAMPFTVRGVVKDLPKNSTIYFDFLTNYENFRKSDGTKISTGDWGRFVDAAFFHIPEAANAVKLEGELKKYVTPQNAARADWKVAGFKCVSLRQHANMKNMITENGLYERPDDSATYTPLILAFLVFLSACLNFSNTTVATSGKRLKEIGVRKVMGSTYVQLIWQLLLECSVIVLAAILFSALINMWWIPEFNSMFNTDVSTNYFGDKALFLFMCAMLLLATLMAGAYPAFYISRFNPVSIFRGSVKFGGSNLFSRLMLGLQLSIAVITVIASIAFSLNADFQKNYDYGYSIDRTMGVSFRDSASYTVIKNALTGLPGIESMGGARNHIGFDFHNVVAESEGMKKETDLFEVGRDYISTMKLKLVAGRGFDAGLEGDFGNALLISQKLVAMYGWKEESAIGKKIFIDSVNYAVVGVLKDFQDDNLFSSPEPVAMKLGKENRHQYLVIQAAPKDLTAVYAKTEEIWKRLFPNKPFTGFYQNEILAEGYRVNVSIAKVFYWFAIVSILLTATGLFALVSSTALKKMKEIALRRVVGANAAHIAAIMNKGYVWIFLIASLFGCAAGYALTKLLLDLIFRINAGIHVFSMVGSVIVLLLIAVFVSGIKVWQAVRINPVKSLRTE